MMTVFLTLTPTLTLALYYEQAFKLAGSSLVGKVKAQAKSGVGPLVQGKGVAGTQLFLAP